MNELALHLLDIAQNSIRANAQLISILIKEAPNEDQLIFKVDDDGHGMTSEQLEKATNPFYTTQTTRKVGLGLPLLKYNAELTGGSFMLHSETNKGTHLQATFGFHHIDRPFLGDIAGTLLILASNEKQSELIYTHQSPKGEFLFDTREIKQELDGIPLTTPEVRKFLMEMIQGNLEQIQISE
ncbi:ATP-binding protein [Sunxiuqinia elliptica]|uniref:histidine kinase n=1 Tax=Sunxiuqinia elliptica TaxID=655355 RepID=A0A1I2L0Z6_9BACT|nr:sensor histidine kinase [Sunxiuqinia elliptica]SFF72875.1 Histidine kinase-, DNA gyrase B-, and HSP90-like ATPase [Sunxiuqinia elliptica]